MRKTVYLDHAATTPVAPEVLEAMLPHLHQEWGNPSSAYSLGRQARAAVEDAREAVAEILGCEASEVVFTGSGSESDNLALLGAALAARSKADHLVTSRVEHHAVLHACQHLETRLGFRVTYVPVDRYGQVDADTVEEACVPGTLLISVMLANNEVGTLQPVRAISEVARKRGVLVHTDAVQAAGALDIKVDSLGVDLLSLSAHKYYGPKGIGVLYVRSGTPLVPLIHGGAQERERRAGTENVAGIVGLAAALRLACDHMQADSARFRRWRDMLAEGLTARIPGCHLTGHPTERLPNNASFVISGVEGESLLLAMDLEGLCASSGSACAAGSLDPSHVLLAMGVPYDLAKGALRLTVGRQNTEADILGALEVVPRLVERLRGVGGTMPPAYH